MSAEIGLCEFMYKWAARGLRHADRYAKKLKRILIRLTGALLVRKNRFRSSVKGYVD